jgi:hypothetical protein
MDSTPAHHASWKIRLVAFGTGIIVAGAVFATALGSGSSVLLIEAVKITAA